MVGPGCDVRDLGRRAKEADGDGSARLVLRRVPSPAWANGGRRRPQSPLFGDPLCSYSCCIVSIGRRQAAGPFLGARHMPKADARLYAALLRAGRRFRSAGMPLLGVAGTDVVCWDLSWPATVRRELQAPPPGVGLAGERSGQGRKLIAPPQLNFCRMSACSWRPNRSAWPATLATSACPPLSPCTWLAAEGAQVLSKLQRQLGLLLQAEEHTREVRHLCECCLCRAAMLLV